jgi:translation initiation factor IF-2
LPKIRVHELAKEFEISSKELLNFLDKLNIKDKKAASNLNDDESGTVRNFFRNAAANTAKMAQEQGPAKKSKPAEDKSKKTTPRVQSSNDKTGAALRRPERNEGFRSDQKQQRPIVGDRQPSAVGSRPEQRRQDDKIYGAKR